MSVPANIATKFLEKIVYGLGFGIGMGLSWKLTNKMPYSPIPSNHINPKHTNHNLLKNELYKDSHEIQRFRE